jgi:hypothetical protein
MKKTLFADLTFCLLVMFIITGCVDHYKVYYANGIEEKQYKVKLKDQFESKEAALSKIEFFANPVSKNGGKIYDRNTHLAWYRLDEHETPIKRSVTFSNQFGTQTWIIGKAVFLLVPTEKIEKSSSEPDKSKHFKCYEVLSGQSLNNKKVTLEDQFGKQVVVINKPIYFCTPVQKNNEKSSNEHLACYQVTLVEGSGEDGHAVDIKNQFGQSRLNIEKSYMLCVPSDKKKVEELGEEHQPILLKTASGIETKEFQLHDSILLNATNLSPRTGYKIQIVREDNKIITESRLSTDQHGQIPETVIWYDIGILPCLEMPIDKAVITHLSEHEVSDFEYAGKNYTLNIMKDEKPIRQITFRVAERMIRPTLYTADTRGCPKSGFLIGEEDVWVIGSNFPKGSIIRLWAVTANTQWKDADQLKDATKQYYSELPSIFELKGDNTSFKKLLWSKGLTSIGSYDIVAEVVTYPFGSYHVSSTAQVQNFVSHLSYSGFVIQRRQGVAEPLEMDLAGTRQSQLTYRDTFLTTENVYVGVDPTVQPNYMGKTADIYIVVDKPDAQWLPGTILNDVTNYVEHITVQYVCSNCWATLAWTAPLSPGKYDVVLDFNQNGNYDPGIDLIDSLDPVGFIVSEVRVNSISFNYSGSGAITIYDNVNNTNINPPEYSTIATSKIKPAAWVMGGSHSVKVDFKAVPTVSSAQIWAETGLGGLGISGSPVLVSFTNGSGQGVFNVNNVPTSVGKHLFYWDWKYKISTSTESMGSTGEHLLYTVLATPVVPMTAPSLEILDYACTWASGTTTSSGVCSDILSNGFGNHYTWNMDCHRLASDFVRLVSTQGINASQHRWASKGGYGVIDDMAYQKTNVIDPVGAIWGSGQIDWSWHQWAEADGAQRDAAAAVSLPGSWGVYEDHLFAQYKKIANNAPYTYQWMANQNGQSMGCEAPAHRDYNSNPTLHNWRGPDR